MKTTFPTRQDHLPSGFRVETLASEHGERYPLIISRASGLPLFSPSVWLIVHRRNSGLAAGTLSNNAHTLASLYGWAEARGIDLDQRFRAGEFLLQWEVTDLTNHLRAEVRTLGRHTRIQRLRPTSPAREPLLASVVTSGVGNYRLEIAADYLYWLGTQAADRFHNLKQSIDAENAEKHRDTMIDQLRGHKQIAKGRNSMGARMAPEPAVIARLIEVVQVEHPENPWADPPRLLQALHAARQAGKQAEVKRVQSILTGKLAIRLRNRLIVHLLFHLGIRRGELLGLKAGDLKGRILEVLRHPDDPDDPRKFPPNTKTRDRKLPVNPGLQAQWLDYVSLIRSQFPLARKHPYLIVNHLDGSPLSFPGLAKVFDYLRGVEGLPSNLTAHHLRHAWNEAFSLLADDNNLDPVRETQLRAELMGWNPGARNPTAMIYLRRHTKRKAQEISLKLQGEAMHPNNSRDLKNCGHE